MKQLLFPLILTSLVSPAFADLEPVKEFADQGFLKCDAPKSRIYDAMELNDSLPIAVIADRKSLEKRDAPPQKAVIAVNVDGDWDYVPVLYENRGNSRGDACTFKPYRLIFLDKKVEKSIEAAIGEKEGNELDKEFLFEYYKELKKIDDLGEVGEDVKVIGKKQKKNVFKGLGKDVKIVSHCGKSKGWDAVGGENQEEAEVHLLSEFYVYKILELFKTTVEWTRLSNAYYFDSDGSQLYADDEVKSRYAIFREPKNSIRKRCGLKKPDAEGRGRVNEDSELQTKLLETFIHNTDYGFGGHNINIFNNEDNEKVLGMYDFDLAGIFDYEYNGELGPRSIRAMGSVISGQPNEKLIPLLSELTAQNNNIAAVIKESLLPEERKQLFNKWLEVHMGAIETWLEERMAAE